MRLIPTDFTTDLRREAEIRLAGRRPRSIVGSIAIIAAWLAGTTWIGAMLLDG